MKTIIQLSMLCFFLISLTSCSSKKVITSRKAPPKIKSMKAEDCGSNKIYTMGHWTVKDKDFVWVEGKCKSKKKGQNWIPAHWEQDKDGVHILKQGRWVEIKPKMNTEK